MATNERFTAYLSPEERAGIRRLARRYNASENYIVRLMIRQALQLPTSSPVSAEVHLTVTNPTS